MDETVKLLSYINIPSLQEYVQIEQDYVMFKRYGELSRGFDITF